MAPLGLSPAHAGSLRSIALQEGITQRSLARLLGILPSSLVALLDTLEAKGMIERRKATSDRRRHGIFLAEGGRTALERIGEIARQHDDIICAGLEAEDREQLHEILVRLAESNGLTPGVHPGFKQIGRGDRVEQR